MPARYVCPVELNGVAKEGGLSWCDRRAGHTLFENCSVELCGRCLHCSTDRLAGLGLFEHFCVQPPLVQPEYKFVDNFSVELCGRCLH